LLYLENNLTSGVFSSGRIAVLKLLASQAAIALENARLYGDLAEREAKIRRLVDANIIGICISRRDGDIIEANDAFLKMVGYDREDLVAGRLRWTDLTTPESYDGTAIGLAELQRTGTIQPFEREYFRRDGSRVPALMGGAAFSEEQDELVAFVLDLTERKGAEEKARVSERRYHEVELELAHTNRVAMMGQLSASVAHEVSQPIAAVATNAKAGLRWLGAQPPDLDEVGQALSRIVENASRATEVISRIRALIKKAPPRHDDVAVNDAVREVIALAEGEVQKIGAVVLAQLQEGLPLIQGDRVQLQQVILNLIINAVEALGEAADAPRELLISTGTEGSGDVCVAVRDSGPGLEPAKLERLFEPFYTTKPGGMGMGLSICRSIIEAHGGRLWAEANEPRGAIFRFTVPAQF
jgi:PAS domain S-box-containing protein